MAGAAAQPDGAGAVPAVARAEEEELYAMAKVRMPQAAAMPAAKNTMLPKVAATTYNAIVSTQGSLLRSLLVLGRAIAS